MPSCGDTPYLSPPAGVHADRELARTDGGVGGEGSNGGRGGACGISSMAGSDAGACSVEPASGAGPLASRSKVELRTQLLSLAFLARASRTSSATGASRQVSRVDVTASVQPAQTSPAQSSMASGGHSPTSSAQLVRPSLHGSAGGVTAFSSHTGAAVLAMSHALPSRSTMAAEKRIFFGLTRVHALLRHCSTPMSQADSAAHGAAQSPVKLAATSGDNVSHACAAEIVGKLACRWRVTTSEACAENEIRQRQRNSSSRAGTAAPRS